jgi:hypothetical protein
MRYASGKIDLMVILLDPDLVDEFKLGKDRAQLEVSLGIQVWDVADNKVRRVNPKGIPLLQKPLDVVVMIGQFD